MRAPDRERRGPRSGHDAGAAVTDLDALLEQAVAALARPRRATYRERRGGAPTLPAAALFASFPVTLLESEAP